MINLEKAIKLLGLSSIDSVIFTKMRSGGTIVYTSIWKVQEACNMRAIRVHRIAVRHIMPGMAPSSPEWVFVIGDKDMEYLKSNVKDIYETNGVNVWT